MNLIRLTEITKKEGGGTKSQPILLNPEIITSVTTGEFKGDQIHIVGETKIETVTFITFRNGQGTFVRETLDEVDALVSNGVFRNGQK